MRNHRWRRLLSLFLTLSLIAAGGASGVAHAATAPAGGLTPLVICSADGGMTTIHVDEHGNAVDPTEPCPAMDCPHCVLVVLSALPLPAAWTGIHGRMSRWAGHVADDAPRSRQIARARARAPPIRA